MSRGNSLKIYFVPIPFCGPSLCEVILTHEVIFYLLAEKKKNFWLGTKYITRISSGSNKSNY